MDKKILDQILELAEEFFGTSDDPRQVSATTESEAKMSLLHPKSNTYRIDNSGKVKGYASVIPTDLKNMELFLSGKISEKELLDLSQPAEKYETVYLFGAFVRPEYRRRGLCLQMMKEAVSNMPSVDRPILFAWPFTPEGRKLAQKVASELNLELRLKE